MDAESLKDLAINAQTTPSLEAEANLEVLTDALIEANKIDLNLQPVDFYNRYSPLLGLGAPVGSREACTVQAFMWARDTTIPKSAFEALTREELGTIFTYQDMDKCLLYAANSKLVLLVGMHPYSLRVLLSGRCRQRGMRPEIAFKVLYQHVSEEIIGRYDLVMVDRRSRSQSYLRYVR